MAKHRSKVPSGTKQLLIDQAGGKCANPGCPNILVQIHHVQEWHVYQAHDSEHMIAICATCHDHVHRGDLRIDDDTLYRWKDIPRNSPERAHLYVEPGEAPRLFLGAFVVRGDSGVAVFDFSPRLRLSFGVREGEIMLLNLKLSNERGDLLIDVVEGHVRKHDPSIKMLQRPGRVQIPITLSSGLVPDWVVAPMLVHDPLFKIRPRCLLDLEVLEPSLVRVEGIWMDTDEAVVITDELLSFVHRGVPEPLSNRGHGMDTQLQWTGPLNRSLFGDVLKVRGTSIG